MNTFHLCSLKRRTLWLENSGKEFSGILETLERVALNVRVGLKVEKSERPDDLPPRLL